MSWLGLLVLLSNRSGDSGHLCLVPTLRGKAFSFSPLSVILVVGLFYIAFIMLRYVSLLLKTVANILLRIFAYIFIKDIGL